MKHLTADEMIAAIDAAMRAVVEQFHGPGHGNPRHDLHPGDDECGRLPAPQTRYEARTNRRTRETTPSASRTVAT